MNGNGPTPPDFQGAANQDIYNNRPNISTPFGSLGWTKTPGTYEPLPDDLAKAKEFADKWGGDLQGQVNQKIADWQKQHQTPDTWQANVTLTPDEQAALDSQQRLQAGRSKFAESLLGNATNDLANGGVNWASLPGLSNGADVRNRAEDAIYSRATARLDPQFSQQENQLRTRLYNTGLREGDKAYDTAFSNFGNQKNDAYNAALAQAITGGGAEASRQQGLDIGARNQTISEGLQRQYGGLNALNAALTGQQVAMPQFNLPGMNVGNGNLSAAQLGYQGALNQYAAQQAQMGNLMGGIGSMAALPFMF